MNGLSYIEYEMYRNGNTYYAMTAVYKGYGFRLIITDMNTGKEVFTKFLRTQDINYCGNYIRKVVRNNFGAVRA